MSVHCGLCGEKLHHIFGHIREVHALSQTMEDGGRLVLLQNGGEVMTPHEKPRLVGTASTLGHGDESGLHTGTKVLSAAFLERFSSVYELDYMDSMQESQVITMCVPDPEPDLADKPLYAQCP